MTRQTETFTANRFLGAALICAAFLLFGAPPVQAQTIVLRDAEGGLEIEGRYLGHTNDLIRIETEAGRLTFDRARIRCEGQACPGDDTPPTVRFSGATRLGEIVLPALVEGYARSAGLQLDRDLGGGTVAYTFVDGDNAAIVRFEFRATTTEDGFADLLSDEADVLLAFRTLSQAELDLAQEAGLGALDRARQAQLLGLDALTPVVSPRLGIEKLSLAQVIDGLTGEVTNWSAFGGPDLPIVVHMPDPEHAMTWQVEQRLLQQSLPLNTVFHDDPASTSHAIAVDRRALGVVPIGVVGTAFAPALEEPCGRALVPTVQSVATSDYPMTTGAVLYQARRVLPEAWAEFRDWIDGDEAQAILRRAGIVTEAPSPISLRQQGDRLAAAILAAGPEVSLSDLQQALQTLEGKVRLSPTFRFDEDAPGRLDDLSLLQIQSLARRIEDGAFDGRRLTFVGFSDSAGNALDNLALSRERADAVLTALEAALPQGSPDTVSIDTQGLGEIIPVACDTSPWGWQSNRRVELWVQPLE